MWPFNRKKKIEETPKPICQHKYKDFPWYMDGSYNIDTETVRIRIYEPYVCIHCGHRKDVLLEEIVRMACTFKEAKKLKEEICSDYEDKLQLKAIVEDMINDMVLVDQQYLDIYMKLHGERFKKNDEA